MKPRTLGEICVGVSGNLQGTYLFLSLATWKILKRRQWVKMPIPQDVINFINKWAENVGGVSITSEMRMGGSAIGEESEDVYVPDPPEGRDIPTVTVEPQEELEPTNVNEMSPGEPSETIHQDINSEDVEDQ